MNRLRSIVLGLVVTTCAVSSFGQDVVGGNLLTRFAFGPAVNATNLNLDTPFNADGVVTTVTVSVIPMDGSSAPCPAGDMFTVRFFREGAPGYTLIAERGPFSETLGTQVITLSPSVTVQRGDVIALYENASSRCAIGGSYGTQFRTLYIPVDYRGGTFGYFVQSTNGGYSVRASSSSSAYVGTLPGGGVTTGAAGSSFNTLITMMNPSANTVQLTFALRPFGTSGSTPAATANVTLGSLTAKTMKFQELFPSAALGSVDVYSNGAPPVLSARVYNESGTGTNGFTEPMVTPESPQVARDQDAVWLPMPADFSAFRMNIGVRAFNTGARMSCQAISAIGTPVASTSKDYPANWSSLDTLQGFFDGNVAALVPGGSVYCTVTFPSSAKSDVVLYGTVTDNRTNDSALVFADKH